MSTEAQRARNARKRAKLKAHRQLRSQEERVARYHCAIRGIRDPFPDFCRDYPRSGVGGFTCDWDWTIDYFTVTVEASADAPMSEIRHLARVRAADVYGFKRWDLDVRVLAKFLLSE